jgi:hypothetical protein
MAWSVVLVVEDAVKIAVYQRAGDHWPQPFFRIGICIHRFNALFNFFSAANIQKK